jgi:methylmalonyl-CoA/ethylmalonyl-CoA epimerase
MLEGNNEKTQFFTKFQQVDQIGVVVKDMDRNIKFYKMLGLEPFLTMESPLESAKLKFGLFQLGEIQLELIQVLEGSTIHSKFLKERGEGLHHLGFFVEDIEEELVALEKEGIKVLKRGIVEEVVKFAYLDTEQNLGIILELIQLEL